MIYQYIYRKMADIQPFFLLTTNMKNKMLREFVIIN